VAFLLRRAQAITDTVSLSLHDALPIFLRAAGIARGVGLDVLIELDHDHGAARGCRPGGRAAALVAARDDHERLGDLLGKRERLRSEEHTSELQSRENLVCRLLLEKNKC